MRREFDEFEAQQSLRLLFTVIRLVTRNGNNATRRFAPVAAMLERLRFKQAIIDGEVAVPDARGVTHISLLDEALKSNPARLAFTPSISCS